MSVAVLENVGAVGRLEVPETPDGGIVVFVGKQGTGKTTAISAIDALISGKKPNGITTKDGELFGKVEGWGAKLTLGDRVRRTGEIEVTSIEGRIDPGLLVNPGIKDPAIADEHRIKALVSLAAVKPDLSLFHDAFGSKELFDAVVKPSSIQTGDLVAMSGALKRDADAAALASEREADELAGRAKAKFEKPEGIDESASCDENELALAYDEAVMAVSRLQATKEANDQIREDAEVATERLQEIGDSGSKEEAQKHLADSLLKFENDAQSVKELEVSLRKAKERCGLAEAVWKAARKQLEAAEQSDKQRQTLLDLIDRAKNCRVIDKAEIEAALVVKDEARAAVQKGQRVRDYLANKADGERLSKQSIAARQKADRLRKAAAATQDVLSAAVQKAGIPELRVDNGRLVTRTKRGKTLFADLSEGERWRIAIDIAIRQVGRGGIFAVNQVAFDSIDIHNRRAINEQVRAAGVTIITAETLQDDQSNGEIGVRIYE